MLEAQAEAVLRQQRGVAGTGGALVVGPGGGAEARGSITPVPERLWASRNVANNLMRFGEPMQVGEAVGMLEEAVSAARQHYGADHPAQLPVLLDLVAALAAAAANEAAAAGPEAGGQQAQGGGAEGRPPAAVRLDVATEELMALVTALCDRYQSARDPLSCVLLLEAAGAEVGAALRAAQGRSGAAAARGGGGAAAALAAAAELAAELMYALKPPEARAVMTARRDGELPRLLRRLARDFTEELGAYAAGKRNRWVDAWNRREKLPPLRP
ncbi:hypothetical protein TSOC_011084 [Tetrabaena socialis]|uniref:Uncharacterized protein n=1 Tax=Tetrabaena socialis TaxID=47790 RepID=A0A2J7ZRL3_9CHLO|nr:hypothetical protein TSOC_011084 [Tetrabaena socialis]|eukprot:PNH02911.1 hypothetical protein TSOC_011084 [Tetrabaena socialis]